MKLNPYLTFDGTAAEAMTFYQSILGGELTIMTFGDMPDTSGVPEEAKSRVAHARLELGVIALQASDKMGDSNMGQAHNGFSGFDLQIEPDSVASGREIFDKLSEGGEVLMPYEKTFWAEAFGLLKDKFGVPWMVNVGS
jgi:PhnB protein